MKLRSLFAAVACLLCVAALAVPVKSAQLNAYIVKTDTADYAPGDTVFITGSAYWPNEMVTVQVKNVFNPGVGDTRPPWNVTCDPSGAFMTFWIVPGDGVDQTFRVTATGLSSGIVSTTIFTDCNTKLEFSQDFHGDSLCPGQVLNVCGYLSENCGNSTYAPLPGREILFFINSGNCGNNISQVADDSAITDANGLACASLTLPNSPGHYSIRIKFRGEDKPALSSPPNSACDPSRRTELSASNECQGIEIGNYGHAPVVTLPPDTTIRLCAPGQICLPMQIDDQDCDVEDDDDHSIMAVGPALSFDQIRQINQLGGLVWQVGGGASGKKLLHSGDFVPSINTQSGLSVTLPGYKFATRVADYGSFPRGFNSPLSADQLVGAPTGLKFTLTGAGGPDGGNGDGTVEFGPGNRTVLEFSDDENSCDDDDEDLVMFSSSRNGGTVEFLFKRHGIPAYACVRTISGNDQNPGRGGVNINLPDGITYNQIEIKCLSGDIEIDGVAARSSSDPSTRDTCFQADTSGVYTIIASAHDHCGHIGADTTHVTVIVNRPPVVNAGADFSRVLCTSAAICFPVTFSDPDGNLKTSQLISGPGTLGSGQVCFTPSVSGVSTFILKATDSCGLVDQDTINVTVSLNSRPVAVDPPPVTKYMCAPTQLCYQFVATDADGGTLTWSKISGSGSITSAGQFCFTPTGPGLFSAVVTVADSCGTKDTTSISYTITMNSAPVAVNPITPVSLFQCDPQQVCYQFAASDVNGGPLTWNKLSGSGTVTTSGNWCFTPSGAGSYSISVSVTDSCGKADTTNLTYNISLNGPPAIAFGNDSSLSLCAPQQICLPYTLSDPQGLNRLVVSMISGYGTLDTTTKKICFTPSGAGTYQFVGAVTDSCGASDRDTINVTVTFGQGAQITCPTQPINLTLCAAGPVCQAVTITPPSATITTSFGTFSAGQLCFQADTSGTYVIHLNASVPCGSSSCTLTFVVTISQPPDLVCPGSQNLFICQTGQVCIPVGGAPIATWTVTPIGSFSSGNVCFPADSSGHYVLKVKASTPCGTDSCNLIVDVTIDSKPVAVDPPTPVDTFICGAAQICRQFSATDVNGGTLTWTRLSGSGTVSGSGLWCFTASTAGAYAVLAKVSDSCGKADTVSLTYNVTLNTAPSLSLGNDTTVFMCASGPICLPFTLSDANNNITGVALLAGIGTVSTNPNQLCFTPAGTGTLQFIASATDACGATKLDTINVTVQLDNAPVANAGPDQTVFQCSALPICWPAGATDIDGNLTSVQLVTGPGTYSAGQICFTPTGTLNYEFVLKATDACGLTDYDTVVIYYTLNIPPVAHAGPNQTLFQCVPTQICWPVSCTDANGNLAGCSLISGVGSYSAGQICFTPTVSGTFSFIMEATDACGAIGLDTAVITVTLNSAPVCAVPRDTTIWQCVPTAICLPASATDADGNLKSCQIIAGPGTLSGGNWCYTPSASQLVTVQLRCEDSCGAFCESSFNVQININRPPTIAFAQHAPVFLCASAQICLDYAASDPDAPQGRTVSLVSGSGTLDTLASRVCFTPPASGTYTFIIKIEDACGATDQDTSSVVVTLNSAPTASAGPDQTLFQCTAAQICWPASCQDVDNNLIDCALTGPGSYDGTSICFTPTASGTYQFILTATDACGATKSDTTLIAVTLNASPTIAFGNDTTLALCLPQEICLTYSATDPNGSSGLSEYMVSGYGAIDTAANKVCFTPTAAGVYQFIIKTIDPCGAIGLDTAKVTVTFGDLADIACPTGPIAASLCGPGQVCQQLTITPPSATLTLSYGTYSGGTLCFQADTTGTYQITVIASTTCGADTCQLTFSVNIGGAPQLTCPAPQSKFLCQAGPICVPVGVVGQGSTVTVSPIGTYASGDLCFPADTAGHYVLKIKATTSCGSDSCFVTVDVTLNAPPVATNPNPAVRDTFLCVAGQVCYQFLATDPNGGSLVWTKLSGDGTLTVGGLWCFTTSAAGFYSAVVKVQDSCGAADTASITYNVAMNTAPAILFTSAYNPYSVFVCSSQQVCLPYTVTDLQNNVTLEALLSGIGAVDTAQNKVCFTPPTAGTYVFTIGATDACGATGHDTLAVVVSMNHPPVVNAGSDQTLFQCSPTQICWPVSSSDPDGNLDSTKLIVGPGTYNGTTICFTPSSAGTFTFVLQAKDQCGAIAVDTAKIIVTMNSAPICNLPNDTTFFQCVPTQVSMAVSATDPNNNFDHCEIVTGPGSIVNGFWVYTPSVTETRKVVIQCLDLCGSVCKDSFTVNFRINSAPIVSAGKDTTYFLCNSTTLCWNVSASDPDNNLSTVELISPLGTYNPTTHQICYQAPFTSGQTTQYAFVVKATDACGAVKYDTTAIIVTSNSAPVVLGPPDFTAYLEQVGQLCFDVDIHDVDGNLSNYGVTPIGSYNPITHQVCFNADSTGHYCLYITATDMCGLTKTDTVCIQVVVDECIHVQIEKTHKVYQGQHNLVNIFLNGSGKKLGGFDFLIAYDVSALTPSIVNPGSLFQGCGWEYFSYRFGPNGNCATCPAGLIRIVGLAETNNGAYHPGCFFDGQVGSLATIDFLVSNDRNLNCLFAPVWFYWTTCNDNSLSSKNGDTLWVERKVFDFELNNITNHGYGLPGSLGIPDICLTNPGFGKPGPQRCVDFTNGGVDIICDTAIDARGDLNLNGIAYEVADVVMFTNYFIHGLSAFGNAQQQQGAIAASDVNGDGMPLGVADLVYLIRVLVGDASALPKLDPSVTFEATVDVSDGILEVSKSNTRIGAMFIILEGEVHPELHPEASDMELLSNYDGKETRVLVYNSKGKSSLGSGPVLYLNGAKSVKSVELGSFDGAVMKTTVSTLPDHYSLSQNYPNPFNPMTTIEFALPAAGSWRLVVYNVLGQEVNSWSNEKADAGYYKIQWDASRHASGVYLYRLTSGGFSATKKMVLLK